MEKAMSNSEIPNKVYFKIGDVSQIVGVKPYVLRFWETEFSIVSPQKTSTGQRVYKRVDVETLLMIKNLLYKERYSIEGARNKLRELKKAGDLKEFKEEKVYGDKNSSSRKMKLKQLYTLTKELQALVKRPIKELFRY